ncbi:AAA family ATPase, partial [Candidatus Bathyarchaeota archaeon]
MSLIELEEIEKVLDSSLQNWSKEDKDVLELIEELLIAQKKEYENKKYITALRYS